MLLQWEDGRIVTLVVESYCDGEGQAECHAEGSTSADSGYYTLRWTVM